MRAIFVLTGLLIASVVAGCVQSSSRMIDDRTAIISARGGAGVEGAEVIHQILVKAATVTKEKGFRYFVVSDASDTSRSGALYMPGSSYTSGNVTAYGNSAYYSGTTTTTPAYAMPYVQPGADIVIHMFREGDALPGAKKVWDADSILAAQMQPK